MLCQSQANLYVAMFSLNSIESKMGDDDITQKVVDINKSIHTLASEIQHRLIALSGKISESFVLPVRTFPKAERRAPVSRPGARPIYCKKVK